ncbi:MAG: HEAT repeat domain-containing protein [Candidatus Dormibacteria bacterium]
MPNDDDWLEMYRSTNPTVRLRAARGLVERGATAPRPTLLEILDTLYGAGLGAATEKVLLKRRDPEPIGEMLHRLHSPHRFVREVAVAVLAKAGGAEAARGLVEALSDEVGWVRRAAAFRLAQIAEPATEGALRQAAARPENQTANIKMGFDVALREINNPSRRSPDERIADLTRKAYASIHTRRDRARPD